MKYLKMLGLAAVAAMAFTAFAGAGTASATGGVLCENHTDHCNSKWAVGSHMNFHLKSGTTALLETTGGFFQNTCTGSTVTGKVTNQGSTTVKAAGEVKKEWLTWSGCSGSTATITGGTLEITRILEGTSQTGKGTVFASGFVVTSVVEGLHCYFQAGTTNDLGTFTPGANDLDGILVINAIVSKIDNATHDSNAFCPSTARWTAEYTQTGSTPLYITTG